MLSTICRVPCCSSKNIHQLCDDDVLNTSITTSVPLRLDFAWNTGIDQLWGLLAPPPGVHVFHAAHFPLTTKRRYRYETLRSKQDRRKKTAADCQRESDYISYDRKDSLPQVPVLWPGKHMQDCPGRMTKSGHKSEEKQRRLPQEFVCYIAVPRGWEKRPHLPCLALQNLPMAIGYHGNQERRADFLSRTQHLYSSAFEQERQDGGWALHNRYIHWNDTRIRSLGPSCNLALLRVILTISQTTRSALYKQHASESHDRSVEKMSLF